MAPRLADTPQILRTRGWADYGLVDSGDGKKLERYGAQRVIRPEPQCLWRPAQPDLWDQATATFDPSDEDEAGAWRFTSKPPETWELGWGRTRFNARFTAFRHLAFFPEQAANWAWLEQAVSARERPRVLNLFGYTGVASLVCAAAGAEVTHVDASKKAIGWARENQEMARLADKPIRWIVEDAQKFAEREARRGNRYDIVLLDPPAYGRGPKGEVWQLFDNLPGMVELCREILTPRPFAVVLTAYSIRASFFAMHALMRDAFAGMGGTVESGELVIREKGVGRALSTSLFSRWVAA